MISEGCCEDTASQQITPTVKVDAVRTAFVVLVKELIGESLESIVMLEEDLKCCFIVRQKNEVLSPIPMTNVGTRGINN